uniref:SRCR domain-containing protein n=1 Tax=Cyanoderma ruficeps TaxID=181631 RepID=A0A8C3NU11_9PASS
MRWDARGTSGTSGNVRPLWSTTAATRRTPAWFAQVGLEYSGSRRRGWCVLIAALPAEHQEWRLSGGRDGCAGRVEVFFRGTWSTVCNSTWYETEATVLCRTLGCGNVLQRPSFGHTLPGKMVYLCGSLQPSLAQCQWTFNKSAPCYQSGAAGVICNGTGSFLMGFEARPGSCPLPSTRFLFPPFPGSQGLETPTPTPTAEVTPGNVTVPHAKEGTPTLGTSPPDSVLFVLCLVLAALLLLSVLAFTAALLRLRKKSDSLRHHPREDLLPLRPSQERMEPFPEDDPGRPCAPLRSSSSSSSTSSAEPYWNGSIPPPALGTQWHPAATSYDTGRKCGSSGGETPRMGERDAETTGMSWEWGFRHPRERSRDGSRDRARMGTGMGSTSMRKWDRTEWEQGWETPVSDPVPPCSSQISQQGLPQCPPSPGYLRLRQIPIPTAAPAPPRGSGTRTCRRRSPPETPPHILAGQTHPVPRGNTWRIPTFLRVATTMTSRALPTEPVPPLQRPNLLEFSGYLLQAISSVLSLKSS